MVFASLIRPSSAGAALRLFGKRKSLVGICSRNCVLKPGLLLGQDSWSFEWSPGPDIRCRMTKVQDGLIGDLSRIRYECRLLTVV